MGNRYFQADGERGDASIEPDRFETIGLAQELGARRLEIANVQYHGWAALNKNLLMPTQEQSDRTNQIVKEARESLGQLLIDYVPVDHYAEYPKPCMNGWVASL